MEGAGPVGSGPREAVAGFTQVRRDYRLVRRKACGAGKWRPGLRLCAGRPLGPPRQGARGALKQPLRGSWRSRSRAVATAPIALFTKAGVSRHPSAINNRLRTGTDKGNPTV